MSIRLMSAVWDLDLPAGEKLVLLALADQANDAGVQCWPSVETIMKRCGQGERTVRRALADLEKKGHLTRKHRTGTSTQYHVHPCQSGTPAKSAPLPNTAETPAKLAPKPPVTIPQKATPSSEERASKSAADRFHRLPSSWIPDRPLSANIAAKVAEWPPGKLNDELEALHRWAANASNDRGKGRKLDWHTAWENWLARADSDWRSKHGNLTGRLAHQPDLRGSRPDPSLDLLRASRTAEAAESAASGGPDHWGAWASLPALGSG